MTKAAVAPRMTADPTARQSRGAPGDISARAADLDAMAIAITLFDRLEQAWNLADGDAFGAAFTNDCHFVDIRGTHHQGAPSVGHGHQAIFDSIYAGSVIHYRVGSARTIAPGCVLATATATLDAPGGPTPGANHSQVTAVATEQAAEWAIAAFHNTLIQSSRR